MSSALPQATAHRRLSRAFHKATFIQIALTESMLVVLLLLLLVLLLLLLLLPATSTANATVIVVVPPARRRRRYGQTPASLQREGPASSGEGRRGFRKSS